ncbi:hypothetical protein Aduo_006917 [Ancylostoma duodenale]
MNEAVPACWCPEAWQCKLSAPTYTMSTVRILESTKKQAKHVDLEKDGGIIAVPASCPAGLWKIRGDVYR